MALIIVFVLSTSLTSAGMLSFLDQLKTWQPTGNVVGVDRCSSLTLKEGESAAVSSRAFQGLTLTVTRITRPDMTSIGSCANQNVEIVLSASSPSVSESHTLFRSPQKPNEIRKASTLIKFEYAGLDQGGNKLAGFSIFDHCKIISLMSGSFARGSDGKT